MKTTLRKIKWNSGEIDGTKYDYTRIYVEIPVYDKQEKEFGVDVLELELGNEEAHKKLLYLRGHLPVECDVEWYAARKGKDGIVNVVTKLDILENPVNGLPKQKPQAQTPTA